MQIDVKVEVVVTVPVTIRSFGRPATRDTPAEGPDFVIDSYPPPGPPWSIWLYGAEGTEHILDAIERAR